MELAAPAKKYVQYSNSAEQLTTLNVRLQLGSLLARPNGVIAPPQPYSRPVSLRVDAELTSRRHFAKLTRSTNAVMI